MKKILVLFTLFCAIILSATGQEITEKDGIYYSDSTPYTGIYTNTYGNGHTKFSVNLENGLKNGEMRVYFENGKLNEIRHYKNNQMDGTWLTFNENEIQLGLANYKDGKKHGEWKVWDDLGHLIYEMNYVDGEKAGSWKKFDANGQLLSERTF